MSTNLIRCCDPKKSKGHNPSKFPHHNEPNLDDNWDGDPIGPKPNLDDNWDGDPIGPKSNLDDNWNEDTPRQKTNWDLDTIGQKRDDNRDLDMKGPKPNLDDNRDLHPALKNFLNTVQVTTKLSKSIKIFVELHQKINSIRKTYKRDLSDIMPYSKAYSYVKSLEKNRDMSYEQYIEACFDKISSETIPHLRNLFNQHKYEVGTIIQHYSTNKTVCNELSNNLTEVSNNLTEVSNNLTEVSNNQLAWPNAVHQSESNLSYQEALCSSMETYAEIRNVTVELLYSLTAILNIILVRVKEKNMKDVINKWKERLDWHIQTALIKPNSLSYTRRTIAR